MLRSFKTQPSVVEAVLDRHAQSTPTGVAASSGEQPHPGVNLAPGEVLLHVHGGASAKSVLLGSFASTVLTGYLGAMFTMEYLDMSLLSKPWLAAFSALCGTSMYLAKGYAHAYVKHAVLSSDGMFVRFYTYGAFYGLGHGKVTTIAIPTLRRDTPVGGQKRITDCLLVAPAESNRNILLDKPSGVNGLGVNRVSHAGITFNREGLDMVEIPDEPDLTNPAAQAASRKDEVATSRSVHVSELRLPAESLQRLRSYALLSHIVSGNTVNMDRVRAGDWQLETMCSDLDPTTHMSEKEKLIRDFRYWRKATTSDGRHYWYDTRTWRRSWTPPVVDGKGPYEHHPDLARTRERMTQ